MLARVLMTSILRLGLPITVAAAVGAAGVAGGSTALGVVAGAALALASGLGLVWLVGQILVPGGSSGAASVLLGLKLAAVLGLGWALLSSVDPLGFVIGLGVGLLGVVGGAQTGQASEAGQRAMAEEERRIREGPDSAHESRDSGSESR
jgi:hypothetical protein